MEKMWHGVLQQPTWKSPILENEFDVNARLTFTHIKAHEYREEEETLKLKIKVLADLIRRSRKCVAYTGAGISTSAGIDDYATKVRAHDRGALKQGEWKDARPTKSHRVLTAMFEAGYLKHWIQQNHDSLPQKAGYPQWALNEIHGSLHDPANPIVPYEGTLRSDLCRWMEQWQEEADLVLALGTSMSGFTADNVPLSAAKKMREGTSLGLVIVNLQQTVNDKVCALRIFERIDKVMELLAAELGSLSVKPMDAVCSPLTSGESNPYVFQIPFTKEAVPSQRGLFGTKTITWDLSIGSTVKLTGGPYAGDVGTIVERSEEGHIRIRFENSINSTFMTKRRPFSLWMGSWWIEMALSGRGITPIDRGLPEGCGMIPFLNVPKPKGPAAKGGVKKYIVPEIDFARYDTMIKLGLCEALIRQKMGLDCIPPESIEHFWESRSSGVPLATC
jgi:NAD-dependent SIR2 family protein deacetylase